LSSVIFSRATLSGMQKTVLKPMMQAAIASPTPVLPEVHSTIVPPGFKWPASSAASIIETPIRSFALPPGLKDSTFA
jgi:hypothetical protein